MSRNSQSQPGRGAAIRPAGRHADYWRCGDGGYTAQVADACIVVPTVNASHVTPHTEAFQAVVWHLLVTHPD